MNNVIASNTHYNIYGYKLGDNSRLEKFVSVWDETRHCYDPLYSYDSETCTLRIPRGIDPYKVTQITNMPVSYDQVVTGRKIKFNMNLIPRNILQNRAIRFLTGDGEYGYTGNSTQLVLSLPSGGGKTYCAIAAMSKLGLATIIITHNDDIRNQWRDRILSYSDIPDKSIVSLSSSSIMHKYLKKDRNTTRQIKSECVYIVTHSLLRSYKKTYGPDSLNELFERLGIGIKIIDECHKEFFSTIDIDNSVSVYKNFYLTATFARTDEIENTVFQRVFQHVQKLYINDDDFGVDKNVIYITEIMSTRASQIELGGMRNGNRRTFSKFSIYKYIDYAMRRGTIIESVMSWLEYFINTVKIDGTIVIMSPKKDTCEYFRQLAQDKYPDKTCCVHNSDSKVEDVGKYDIVCSTVKMIGTGNDITNLKLIINIEPIGSTVNIYQIFHRLMRGNDAERRFYVDIIDKSVPNVYDMYKRCRKTLEDAAKKHIILDKTKKGYRKGLQ